jgi:hypothetical protein
MMTRTKPGVYESAELLCALWKLGAENSPMPDRDGVLDRALYAMRDRLPEALSRLDFSNGSVGLRCLDLPDILSAAVFLMAAEHSGPAFDALAVSLSEDTSLSVAYDHGLSSQQARALGTELFDSMRAAPA